MTHRHNISVDSNGVPMVLHGYMTSLAVSRRLSGVYTLLLRNEFGEYYRQFAIPSGTLFVVCTARILLFMIYRIFIKTFLDIFENFMQ